MENIIGRILRALMGAVTATPDQHTVFTNTPEHINGPITVVYNINGERVELIEYPKMYYKNHPNKPNNDEPRHKWHLETTGAKINWAQRKEFKKRAVAWKGAAAAAAKAAEEA
jgi:hypothetical protein